MIPNFYDFLSLALPYQVQYEYELEDEYIALDHTVLFAQLITSEAFIFRLQFYNL
jgi:hypothetical protein